MDDLTEFTINSKNRLSKRVSFAEVKYIKEFVHEGREHGWGNSYEQEVKNCSTSSLELTEAMHSAIILPETKVHSNEEIDQAMKTSSTCLETAPDSEKTISNHLSGLIGISTRDQLGSQLDEECNNEINSNISIPKTTTEETCTDYDSCSMETTICSSPRFQQDETRKSPVDFNSARNISNVESEITRYVPIPMIMSLDKSVLVDNNSSLDGKITDNEYQSNSAILDTTCHFEQDIEFTNFVTKFNSEAIPDMEETKINYFLSKQNAIMNATEYFSDKMEMSDIIQQDGHFNPGNIQNSNSMAVESSTNCIDVNLTKETSIINDINNENNPRENSMPTKLNSSKKKNLILRDRTNLMSSIERTVKQFGNENNAKENRMFNKVKENIISTVTEHNTSDINSVIPQNIDVTENINISKNCETFVTGSPDCSGMFLDEKTTFAPIDIELTKIISHIPNDIVGTSINDVTMKDVNLCKEKTCVLPRNMDMTQNVTTATHFNNGNEENYISDMGMDEKTTFAPMDIELTKIISHIPNDIVVRAGINNVTMKDVNLCEDKTCFFPRDMDVTQNVTRATHFNNGNEENYISDMGIDEKTTFAPIDIELTKIISRIPNDIFVGTSINDINLCKEKTCVLPRDMDVTQNVTRATHFNNGNEENYISDIGMDEKTTFAPIDIELTKIISHIPNDIVVGTSINDVTMKDVNLCKEKTCALPRDTDVTQNVTRATHFNNGNEENYISDMGMDTLQNVVQEKLMDENTCFIPQDIIPLEMSTSLNVNSSLLSVDEPECKNNISSKSVKKIQLKSLTPYSDDRQPTLNISLQSTFDNGVDMKFVSAESSDIKSNSGSLHLLKKVDINKITNSTSGDVYCIENEIVNMQENAGNMSEDNDISYKEKIDNGSVITTVDQVKNVIQSFSENSRMDMNTNLTISESRCNDDILRNNFSFDSPGKRFKQCKEEKPFIHDCSLKTNIESSKLDALTGIVGVVADSRVLFGNNVDITNMERSITSKKCKQSFIDYDSNLSVKVNNCCEIDKKKHSEEYKDSCSKLMEGSLCHETSAVLDAIPVKELKSNYNLSKDKLDTELSNSSIGTTKENVNTICTIGNEISITPPSLLELDNSSTELELSSAAKELTEFNEIDLLTSVSMDKSEQSHPQTNDKEQISINQSDISDGSILSLDSTFVLDFETSHYNTSIICNKTNSIMRLKESKLELSRQICMSVDSPNKVTSETTCPENISTTILDKEYDRCPSCQQMDMRKIFFNGTPFTVDFDENTSTVKFIHKPFCVQLDLNSSDFHCSVKEATYTPQTKDLKKAPAILAMETFADGFNRELLKLVGVNLCELTKHFGGMAKNFDSMMDFLKQLHLVKSCYPTKFIDNRVHVSLYFSSVKTLIELEFLVNKPIKEMPFKPCISAYANFAFGNAKKGSLTHAITECYSERNVMWSVIEVTKVVIDSGIK